MSLPGGRERERDTLPAGPGSPFNIFTYHRQVGWAGLPDSTLAPESRFVLSLLTGCAQGTGWTAGVCRRQLSCCPLGSHLHPTFLSFLSGLLVSSPCLCLSLCVVGGGVSLPSPFHLVPILFLFFMLFSIPEAQGPDYTFLLLSPGSGSPLERLSLCLSLLAWAVILSVS